MESDDWLDTLLLVRKSTSTLAPPADVGHPAAGMVEEVQSRPVTLLSPPPSLIHSTPETCYLVLAFARQSQGGTLPDSYALSQGGSVSVLEKLGYLFLTRPWVVVIGLARDAGVVGYAVVRDVAAREIELKWIRQKTLTVKSLQQENLMGQELARVIRNGGLEEMPVSQGRAICRFLDKLIWNETPDEYLSEREILGFAALRRPQKLQRRFEDEKEILLAEAQYEEYLETVQEGSMNPVKSSILPA